MKIGVLISGRGSNLQSLINAQLSGQLSAEIVTVISNVPDVEGLKRAAKAGIAPSTKAGPGDLDRRSHSFASSAKTGAPASRNWAPVRGTDIGRPPGDRQLPCGLRARPTLAGGEGCRSRVRLRSDLPLARGFFAS